ncbi:Fic/DOC family protein [Bacillus cereus]|uniref:protein adenylyltransferase n=2 Tax=Bacillus cereus TaxID=1396 RepID=E5AK22_BACCE|nr:Fic family protein [Bacillus cereus]MDZ4588716.1 Fic family protein [Bacillus cereus]MDZ4599712.1 Fic family protein [Bacillus cereus]WPA86301.1 Fic family protein [Bacillus cereus]CBW44162.1 fic family protien [Bacillus cereus VPC1401]
MDYQDNDLLKSFETIMTGVRIAELQANPITGNFDLKHLQEIHKYIFQDVYPFAGKLREENIAKGSFQFAHASFLKDHATELFKQLKDENTLKGLKIDEFSNRAAHYMAEINVIHPFREGNGRTQREFIRCLALSNGYSLEWEREKKEAVFNASVKSVLDPTDLSKIIKNTITNHAPDLKIAKQFKTQKQNISR